MVETPLKINPSLCVLSPPAWAQPFTVRGKAFMHQASAYFPACIQPHKPKIGWLRFELVPGLQPDLWNATSSWRISVQFWFTSKSCKVQKLPVPSIRTKNKKFWDASKGCKVQKLGPWVLFNGVEAG